MLTDDLSAYLSRLTGEPLSPAQPIRLRSVQRAALAAWARRQQPPVQLTGLAAEETSALALLGLGPAGQPVSVAAPGPTLAAPVVPAGGLGVDIEMVAALPAADDLRGHPFYQDNFTPAEIAYCIRQRDVRASLAGLWAAKEAVLKAGIAGTGTGALRAIEICHDPMGRPVFPGCQLSISHTPDIAIAIAACIAPAAAPLAGAIPVAAPAPAPAVRAAAVARKLARPLSLGVAAAACVASAIVAGTVALLLPI